MKRMLNYWQFINEDYVGTSENHIATALTNLRNKLEKMFNYYELDRGEIVKVGGTQDEKEKLDKKEKQKVSFQELGLELNDLDMSDNTLILQFSDEEHMYSFTFMIDLKEAVPEDPKKDFDYEDIENCQVIYKKYDIKKDLKIVEGPIEKKCKLKDIDEEFLTKFGADAIKDVDNKNFKIETK